MRQEHWTDHKWRPMMGWMYMVVCILDFAIFPILWSILQAHYKGQVTSQWDPLTLKGAGLFHMAMGAVLGVTAWSRGQEKMAGAQNGSANSVFTTAQTTGSGAGDTTLPTQGAEQPATGGIITGTTGGSSPKTKKVVPEQVFPLL